jgi:hypothetical protein
MGKAREIGEYGVEGFFLTAARWCRKPDGR